LALPVAFNFLDRIGSSGVRSGKSVTQGIASVATPDFMFASETAWVVALDGGIFSRGFRTRQDSQATEHHQTIKSAIFQSWTDF
jgi:hypothetical protein